MGRQSAFSMSLPGGFSHPQAFVGIVFGQCRPDRDIVLEFVDRSAAEPPVGAWHPLGFCERIEMFCLFVWIVFAWALSVGSLRLWPRVFGRSRRCSGGRRTELKFVGRSQQGADVRFCRFDNSCWASSAFVFRNFSGYVCRVRQYSVAFGKPM